MDHTTKRDCIIHLIRAESQGSPIGLAVRCFGTKTDPDLDHRGAAVLRRLALARALRHRIHDEEEHLAHLARASGATWVEIGEAMGVTRQAAQQRWSINGAPAAYPDVALPFDARP